MSALGAIETPVDAAPDARSVAGLSLVGRERPLRVVSGHASAIAVPAGGAAADSQPRSSSKPQAPGAAPVLTGTVVPGRRQRPGMAADSGVSPARLRLTRRGRVVVATLVIAAVTLTVLLITILVPGGAQATNHGQARAGYEGMHQVVVRPGQTPWSIAAAAEPTADPRGVVQEIMSANALGSPSITAGQLLWVP